jgi:hypothetical protein
MMKTLKVLLATVTVLLVLSLAAVSMLNYAHAETRGTVPLESLARRGTGLERSLARAVADSLAARPSLPAGKWYARRERSANGDTIRFRIYRARDATLLGQMLRPTPVIAGGAVYLVSEKRLRGPGIGIR